MIFNFNKFGGIGLGLFCVLVLTNSAHGAMLLFTSESPEDQGNEFVLDVGNDYDEYSIRFGDNISASILFDRIADKFEINRALDLGGNELQNFNLEALTSAPTCDGVSNGRMYFNTSDGHTYVCDGSSWVRLDSSGSGITTNSVEQTTDYNTLVVSSINVLSATSPNRPADKVYIVKTLGNTNLKTQVATTTNERYFRTFQASTWSAWSKIKTKKYANYTIGDIDQTDGTVSYIGRTRDSDSKWLITRSDGAGFTYAQIENNGAVPDMATAWSNRLTLTYGSTFTP